jgi:hypothetical protein
MNVLKLIGITLLFSGILLIFWSSYQSYLIFTGKTLPPEIFKPQKISSSTKSSTSFSKVSETESAKETAIELVKEQLKEVLPQENFLKMFNLISWSIFSGLLIFSGSQLSSLGIKLLKK